nr:uncharacterized protein LOC113803457 [Penaeus vannamei]
MPHTLARRCRSFSLSQDVPVLASLPLAASPLFEEYLRRGQSDLTMYSTPWLLFLVLTAWDSRPSRAFIFPSLPQDVCNRHFSISNDTDLNKLTGEWVTVASTRKVFPCHRFSGKVEGANVSRFLSGYPVRSSPIQEGSVVAFVVLKEA